MLLQQHRLVLVLLLSMTLMVGCTTANANSETEHDDATDNAVSVAITLTATPLPTVEPTVEATATTPPTETLIPTPRATLAPTQTPRPRATQPSESIERTLGTQATATAFANLAAQYADVNALPARVVLPMVHEYQRLNNCAPTTTSMVMRFYGLPLMQADMAALQKPVREDVNVTAEEVAASVREVGLEAYVGHNGDVETVMKLLAAGFPIITEEWIDHEGGMGHFRAVRGYDRDRGQILYNDSFYGPELWRSNAAFLRDWAPYNNKFVLPYRADQEALVRALLGDQWEESNDFVTLLDTSVAQAAANPADAYAWWGQGEALMREGRSAEAVAAFETSLSTGNLPWRYPWYRYGYYEALNAEGRYQDLLDLTVEPLTQMKRSEDLRYHRAVAYNGLGMTTQAIAELEKAIADNPRYIPAQVMLAELGG